MTNGGFGLVVNTCLRSLSRVSWMWGISAKDAATHCSMLLSCGSTLACWGSHPFPLMSEFTMTRVVLLVLSTHSVSEVHTNKVQGVTYAEILLFLLIFLFYHFYSSWCFPTLIFKLQRTYGECMSIASLWFTERHILQSKESSEKIKQSLALSPFRLGRSCLAWNTPRLSGHIGVKMMSL